MRKIAMKITPHIVALVFSITIALGINVANAAVPDGSVVKGLNKFAVDLYQQISKSNQNIAISPYGVSSLLGRLGRGAAGETQTQMLNLFHLSTFDQINKVFSDLDNSLQIHNHCNTLAECKINAPANLKAADNKKSLFMVANAIWTDQSLNYKLPFQQFFHEDQSVHFSAVDFAHHLEDARNHINQWVAYNTNDTIKDLLTKGSITSDTKLLLTNAIYFKGKWQLPFQVNNTQDQPFKLLNGNEVPVAMMHNPHDKFKYSENNSMQMIQLDYQNSSLAMALILPKANSTLQAVQSELNIDTVTALLQNAKLMEVDLYLPKFNLSSTLDTLDKTLQSMGLIDAFNERANFSNMTDAKVLISKMMQKVFVQVDEEGTVAAAATGLVFGPVMYREKIKFNADHPFIFIIFDTQSKVLLFLGQVTDPRSLS